MIVFLHCLSNSQKLILLFFVTIIPFLPSSQNNDQQHEKDNNMAPVNLIHGCEAVENDCRLFLSSCHDGGHVENESNNCLPLLGYLGLVLICTIGLHVMVEMVI